MRVALALATIGILGCRFELTEVEVRDESRAAWLEIATGVAPDGTLILAASFHPGRTAEGVLRVANDDSVRVNGESVAASERTVDGTRRYRLEWGEADRPVGALRLRGPPVPGLEAPPELGVEPLYFRVPDTLVAEGVISIPVIGLGSGEPLLGIDAADLVLLETRSASWSVIVRTDGNLLPLFRLEGGSPPPPVITIDASLIPKGLGDAWLDVQAKVRLALSTDGGGYEIEVYRTAIASVPLRLTPP